jgi:hypothetical protein
MCVNAGYIKMCNRFLLPYAPVHPGICDIFLEILTITFTYCNLPDSLNLTAKMELGATSSTDIHYPRSNACGQVTVVDRRVVSHHFHLEFSRRGLNSAIRLLHQGRYKMHQR